MKTFRRPVPFAIAMMVAASPSAAAVRDLHRHSSVGRLVVHPRLPRPAAATLGATVAPGVVFRTPFTVVAGDPGRVVRVPHYIGPDGTYDEYADLIKSINGTPCGQDCTRRSLERWGYAPVD